MTIEEFLVPFTVIKSFKQTGQKQVFLSQHEKYGEIIVKVGVFESQMRLDRAKREVEIQSAIASKYYPKIIEFIVFPDYRFIILEEFIESQPLSECFDKFSSPLSSLKLLKEIILGMQLLWEKDVIHRDLKPDNILIRLDNSPVIIDLGILLALNEKTLTHPMAPISPCTPNYAAPEQLKNRRASIDYRTDQFILGIDLMQILLGGDHPFDPKIINFGESIQTNIIYNNWNKDIFLDTNYLAMKSLILRLLSPEPYMRYKSITKLLEDINQCIEAYK